MNPDKGKDEKKPGATGGSPGSVGGGGGAPGAGGKDESGKTGGAMGSPGAAGKSGSPGKEDDTKGVQKIFDLYCKSGGGSGITKEDAKKWMKAAGLCDEKSRCAEKDFDKAFDKASKGEKNIDFKGFKELIECICKEHKKEPKEFFQKLVSAGPPK